MISITRLLTPSEWERVLLYSRRVRRLYFVAAGVKMDRIEELVEDNYEDKDNPYLDNITYIEDVGAPFKSVILQSPSPLFPNLRTLSLGGDITPAVIEQVLVPAAPHVRELDVYSIACRDSESIDTIFNHIKDRCNNLEDLLLYHNSNCSSIPHFQPIFPHVIGLKRVHISHIFASVDTLELLGNLPLLEEVYLKHHDQDGILDLTTLKKRPLDFPALQFFSLDAPLQMLPSFLDLAPCNRLKGVELLVTIANQADISFAFNAIVNEIRDRFTISLLCRVQLGIDADRSDFGIAVPFEIIQPLLAFKNLAQFRFLNGIDDPYFLDINNGSVEALAKSWPHLRHLEIPGGPLNFRPNLTIKGLQPLAVHCPHLSHLLISINVSNDVDLSERRPAGEFSVRNLQTLELRNSPVPIAPFRLLDIAALLTSFFPNLICVYYTKTDPEDDEDCRNCTLWELIGGTLKNFVDVRQQEEMTWRSHISRRH